MGLALGLGVGPPYDSFPVAAVVWTPKKLANLSLWLDAADPGTITLNGSTVSQWQDKSGNSRHIAQATAVNQPTYQATGLNSRPTLYFDGADWLFTATPGALLRNVAGGSITAVASYPIVPAGPGVTIAVQTPISNVRLNLSMNTTGFLGSGARRLDADTATGSTASTAQTLNTPVIHGTIADYTGNSIQLFTDGNAATAGTYSSGGGSSSNTDAGALLVGSATSDFGVTAQNPGTVSVSEVILTNSTTSVADRQRIEGYLAWKWGIVANLPVGHPYKTKPPVV
jgi:hypothetical protein